MKVQTAYSLEKGAPLENRGKKGADGELKKGRRASGLESTGGRGHESCMERHLHAFHVKGKVEEQDTRRVAVKRCIVWKSCGHFHTLLWNRLPQSCFHLLQIRRQGSGVWLGDSPAFIINPTATLIYNSCRQMEASPEGTQATHTHTFKASESTATHTHTISFFQVICGMTMSLGM